MANVNVRVVGTWEPNIEAQELSDGSSLYFAEHPELLGVVGQGETVEQARVAFDRNLRDFLAELAEAGTPAPAYTTIRMEATVTGDDHNPVIEERPQDRAVLAGGTRVLATA